MKILQFAFDGNEDNPYLPENIEGENWIVYTVHMIILLPFHGGKI